MNISRYRHNYEGFNENFIYPMCINKWRMITTQGAHASLVKILTFLLSPLVKSIEEEIQSSNDCVYTRS